jgi:tripartite ATP-independent transporter DctM subunit
MPQAERLGYDPRIFSGAIAAGGTLGIMIPPSINLIVYGFLTETSIPQLFLAGLVPGLLLAVAFMAVSAAICMLRPGLGGAPGSAYTWGERLSSLKDLVPILALFAVVVGSIYAGWATPTESAAIGSAMALLIAAGQRGLSVPALRDALLGTIRITAMIMFVIVGAYFLNYCLASAGLGQALRDLLDGLNLGVTGTLLAIVVLYIVLGFFIETLSLMVATIPIVVPIVIGLGYDPVWFGILLILLIEMALITPPVGLNLYVVQGARKGGNLGEVMVGAVPFVLTMLAMAVALIVFPGLALWLPG